MALTYQVTGMTCQHCVKAITQSIQKRMAGVQVDINLDNHLVVVTGASDPVAVAAAIKDAGYSAQQL